MRIAVISDIHGNMEAIEAVEEDIKKQNCDKLFVLGDYAMAGPEPKRAVRHFMEKTADSNVIMIQGNTDLMIADYSEELYNSLKSKAPVMAEALKNDASILTSEEKNFLRSLPPQKEVIEEEVKFLLVHGSPRRNNEDILPDTPIQEVEEMIKGTDANIILCGHTHIPCGFQTSTKQTVVNAGSIGRPFTPEPKSCYLIVEIYFGRYSFEHHFVKYDNKKASDKLRNRPFTGASKLADTLLNPQERHF